MPFATLAVQLGDLRTVMGKQLYAGDMAIRGRLTRYPDFINTVFAQVQGEGGIEDVEPAAHRGQLFQGAGEDLHAAAVANENHDLIALFANGFQQVRQGITGWAQVHGLRGDTSIEKRVEYDIWYIENWSLWLDFKILFMTVFGGMKNAEQVVK